MEQGQRYFQERAAQCRRLAGGVNDSLTIERLNQLAREFDAEASKLEARKRRKRPGPHSPPRTRSSPANTRP